MVRTIKTLEPSNLSYCSEHFNLSYSIILAKQLYRQSDSMLIPFLLFVAHQITALPNFVIILADDLGQYSIGYKNSEILTPTIDSLANTGVLLNEFYTYKFCSPTRASLLTGRYPWKTEGIRTNFVSLTEIDGLNLGFTFLPQRLKEAGYSTHFIGKWHLGFADNRFTPNHRGFDTSYGFFGGWEYHFSQIASKAPICGSNVSIYDNWINTTASRIGLGSSNDIRYTKQAVDIINNHANESNVPLFLYLAYNTPHSPAEAEQRFMNLYPTITYKLQNTFYAMVTNNKYVFQI